MSILLIDPSADVGEEVVTRLVRQGDEVRVLERNPTRASLWTRLGAHVARGDPSDDDLIERAATNCRTIVTFTDDDGLLATATRAARAARVERMIAVVQKARDVPGDVEVIVLVARPKGLFRKPTPALMIAAAVDAADDAAHIPVKVLDLDESDSWASLGLTAP
ncbi:MAG: NAD-binding protein [Actinomycetota bacterium]|nr:NAD-binding protein [Actinomycetota bacterium]